METGVVSLDYLTNPAALKRRFDTARSDSFNVFRGQRPRSAATGAQSPSRSVHALLRLTAWSANFAGLEQPWMLQ
jgi:hypothetical protein